MHYAEISIYLTGKENTVFFNNKNKRICSKSIDNVNDKSNDCMHIKRWEINSQTPEKPTGIRLVPKDYLYLMTISGEIEIYEPLCGYYEPLY